MTTFHITQLKPEITNLNRELQVKKKKRCFENIGYQFIIYIATYLPLYMKHPHMPLINHHARDIKDPITPAIKGVGSPSTADITNCTTNPAISQHFSTLSFLLWWWV